LAAVAAFATPGYAQSTSVNGQIAYVVYSGSTHDIWVMNPDGTGQTNLTNTPDVSETGPEWSPDGTRIAYTRYIGSYAYDIWVMNADGANPVRLTDEPVYQTALSWSPGGTRIAFVRLVPGQVISTQFDIFVMDADGSNPVNITNSDTDELDPAWSPDGGRIAFAGVRVVDSPEGPGGDWQIVTANPDGTDEAILTLATQEDRAPAWSPDGSMIAFMSQFDEPCCGDWEIWAMNRDGTGLTNLTNEPGAGDVAPSWSPDGATISFASTRGSTDGGQFDIYVIPAPTSLPRTVSGNTAALATRLTSNAQASDPDWARADGAMPARFPLFVSRAGRGRGTVTSRPAGIRCGWDCKETYAAGATVALTANPLRGSVFAGWSGACTSSKRTCVVTMDDVQSVVARFERR
jgi:Tol biopolymer transport system component